MVTLACSAFVLAFLIYALDQIGAVDWLWDVAGMISLIVLILAPAGLWLILFGIGLFIGKHSA
jgi:hypothetical protein